MNATLAGAATAPVAGAREPGAAPSAGVPSDRFGDKPVLAALAGLFILIAALTWRKWGAPEIDAGAELTTADLVKHGAVAYEDVRYYYGPLGLYSLALSFKLFGTSFTTAYAFGLAQAAAILAAFYALARHWLAPLTAGLATAMLIAIGFSGTAFNFVLPHTNSATFGLLALLAMLIALTRERPLAAGVAAGLVGLTRPEFAAVAGGAAVAYVLATWRVSGRLPATRAAWRIALPAIVIPAAVFGWFAAQAGVSRLLGENLWPVKFIQKGARTEHGWTPLSIASFIGVLLRASIYIGALVAVVASALKWRGRRGLARVAALWPLAVVGLGCALIDGALRAGDLLAGQRRAIELETRHLLLGMSWLPALGLGVAALAAVSLIRGRRSPLGGKWPADLALIVAAAGLGLRAYNAFTTEGSYAAYYAAPLVLLLGILHERAADRWPQARTAVLGALGLVTAGLAAYALGGLYVHDTTAVHTPRGTFVTTAAAAPALQAAVRRIDADTLPGERILAAPTDGGLYFMADRPPALRELTLLPGLIATPREEAAAIARLRRERVALAAIGARDLSVWGTRTFGVDYDPLLGAYLRGSAVATSVIGTFAAPAGGTNPSKGFTIVRLHR